MGLKLIYAIWGGSTLASEFKCIQTAALYQAPFMGNIHKDIFVP